MESVTLGEIKAYCEANAIEIKPAVSEPTVVSNVQGYGDVTTQAYFSFYLANKQVVDAWVMRYRSMQTQSIQTEQNNEQRRR